MVTVDLLYFKLFFFLMIGFVLFKWDYYLLIVMNMEFVYFVLFYLMLVFSGALFFMEFVVYFFLCLWLELLDLLFFWFI
uniref:NADH dehydrogenase subunit 4L n=1 Tax=Demodex folliculorum TaxID=481310 RepID=A0A0A7DT00_DEMFO|nr:NADH dehydrogenase subunit 4L [Demodex folliculorum]AIW82502.1 NADH dehydrogenase subunit 4L [Demodex folliculorum]